MDKLKQGSLAASSIIEVTVALLLFVVFFSLTLVAYLKLTTTGHTAKSLQCALTVQEIALQAKAERNFVAEEFSRENYTVRKTAAAYEGFPDLVLLQVDAVEASGDTVCQYKEILHVAY